MQHRRRGAEGFSARNTTAYPYPRTYPPSGSEETQGFIDRSLLERMPEGGYLVNTARGGLVAMDDLLWALEGGSLSGAALDVFSQEPRRLATHC